MAIQFFNVFQDVWKKFPTLAGAPKFRTFWRQIRRRCEATSRTQVIDKVSLVILQTSKPSALALCKMFKSKKWTEATAVLHRCVYPSDITTIFHYLPLFTYLKYFGIPGIPQYHVLFGVKAISWCDSMNVTHSKLPTLRITVFAYEIRTKIRIDLSYVDAVDVCLCCARSCWRSLAQKKSPHPTPRRPVLARLLRRCQRRLACRGIGGIGRGDDAAMQLEIFCEFDIEIHRIIGIRFFGCAILMIILILTCNLVVVICL